mgnify:CR=1 FL=1
MSTKIRVVVVDDSALVRGLLAEILKAGVTAGEFTVEDPDAAASYIQDATFRFRYPQLHNPCDVRELEPHLEGVIQLLLTGLQKR